MVVVDKSKAKAKRKSRPRKRTLVRWNDVLDKLLLLTMQWAVSNDGVKMPFKKIAKQMGPKFTEGAIVQHLAKLRTRMVEIEADPNIDPIGAPIPPPLRRGAVAQEASHFYNTAANTKTRPPLKLESPSSESSPAENAVSLFYGPAATKTKARGKKRAISDEDDGDETEIALSEDSGDDWSSSNKKKRGKAVASRKTKKAAKAKEVAEPDDDEEDQLVPTSSKRRKISSPKINATIVKDENISSEDVQQSVEEDMLSPAYHFRGVKKSYAQFDDDSIENGDDGSKEFVVEEEDYEDSNDYDSTENEELALVKSVEVEDEGAVSLKTKAFSPKHLAVAIPDTPRIMAIYNTIDTPVTRGHGGYQQFNFPAYSPFNFSTMPSPMAVSSTFPSSSPLDASFASSRTASINGTNFGGTSFGAANFGGASLNGANFNCPMQRLFNHANGYDGDEKPFMNSATTGEQVGGYAGQEQGAFDGFDGGPGLNFSDPSYMEMDFDGVTGAASDDADNYDIGNVDDFYQRQEDGY